MNYVSVDWACAGSETARRLGFAHGCYTVKVHAGYCGMGRAISGHRFARDADIAAHALGLPFDAAGQLVRHAKGGEVQ